MSARGAWGTWDPACKNKTKRTEETKEAWSVPCTPRFLLCSHPALCLDERAPYWPHRAQLVDSCTPVALSQSLSCRAVSVDLKWWVDIPWEAEEDTVTWAPFAHTKSGWLGLERWFRVKEKAGGFPQRQHTSKEYGSIFFCFLSCPRRQRGDAIKFYEELFRDCTGVAYSACHPISCTGTQSEVANWVFPSCLSRRCPPAKENIIWPQGCAPLLNVLYKPSAMTSDLKIQLSGRPFAYTMHKVLSSNSTITQKE